MPGRKYEAGTFPLPGERQIVDARKSQTGNKDASFHHRRCTCRRGRGVLGRRFDVDLDDADDVPSGNLNDDLFEFDHGGPIG